MSDETETMETVALIANGYEWICPRCNKQNDEIEALEIVQCQECGKRFLTDEYHVYE